MKHALAILGAFISGVIAFFVSYHFGVREGLCFDAGMLWAYVIVVLFT